MLLSKVMTTTRKISHLHMVNDGDDERHSATASLTPAERRQRDRGWVTRIQRGDELAFADIFHAYYLPLSRYAETLVHSRDVALDVVSDVFQKLWLKREELEPIGLWPYLLTATRNRALDMLARRRVEETTAIRFAAAEMAPEMSSTGQASPDDELLLREEARDSAAKIARIEGAYAVLAPRSRQVFELWVKGLSYKEIGRTLKITLKTVDAHLQQAKRTLRQLLIDNR